MPTQITNYQCPACTGPLHFEGQSGTLKCEYCGSSFQVGEIEALYAEKEQKAAAAYVQDAEKQPAAGGQVEQQENVPPKAENVQAAWSTQFLQSDWGDDTVHMQVYSCPSCGAEVICDDTTAATSCLYCGNPTVVPGQFAGALKPDYVIPFKVDKEAAKNALKNHCKGKFLLPKFFSKEVHIEEMKGVYVPFWLFSGSVYADVTYKATTSTTTSSSSHTTTTTHHYNVRRAGTVAFQNIPVDASSKMPNDYMESIEPYDYSELKPFSTAYMPGFFADKYDVAVQECTPRADERAQNSALQIMRRQTTAYTSCVEKAKNIQLSRGNVAYALAPVWLLTTRWNNKVYFFAVNGQTGRFAGNLPCSKARFAAALAGITVFVAALCMAGWYIFA